MTDTDKRNDPDIVVRIRQYNEVRTMLGVEPAWTRDLLSEAADTIAELRAELAAERGEAEGAVGLHSGWGWSRTFHDWWLIVDGVSLGCAGRGRWKIRGEKVTVSGREPGVRANMRAFEAEARRLGMIGEVSDA